MRIGIWTVAMTLMASLPVSAPAQTTRPLTLAEAERLSDRALADRIFDQLADDIVSISRDPGRRSSFTSREPDLRYATLAFRARPVRDIDGLCAMRLLQVGFEDVADPETWPDVSRHIGDAGAFTPPGPYRDQLVARGGDYPKYARGLDESVRFRFTSVTGETEPTACEDFVDSSGFFYARDVNAAQIAGLFVTAVGSGSANGSTFQIDCGGLPDCAGPLGRATLDRIMYVGDCDSLTAGAVVIPEGSQCVSVDLLNQADFGGWTSTRMYAVGRVDWVAGQNPTANIDRVMLYEHQMVVD